MRDRHLLRGELIGIAIAVLAAIVIGLSTDLNSPPRYDGAGYSVLGLSLMTGQGYHEIDQPGAPPHAHFPPGYPLALAAVWSLLGRSVVVAHAFSIVCTVVAVWLAWRWYCRIEGRIVACWLGMALALNWTWLMNGGSIQSEPLFFLISMLVITKATSRTHLIPGWWVTQAGLGVLLGLATLTRHVGICYLAAVVIDRLLNKQWREAFWINLIAMLVITPWVGWVAGSARNHQIGLLQGTGLVGLIGEQALFYARRLPDVLTGPFVEVATVFGRSRLVGWLATGCAIAFSVVLLGGLVLLLRRPRTRLAGLIPLCTIPLLLVWPFTEAGRFLVPLVPCLLLGLLEGLRAICKQIQKLSPQLVDNPRVLVSIIVFMIALPYPAYALISQRAKSHRETHGDFDAACAWIASEAGRVGSVMTRHPGEVFWQTGRQAVAPTTEDLFGLIEQMQKQKVVYLLVDPDRFANAPPTPLSRLAKARPALLKRVREGSVEVYEVLQAP